MHAREPEAGFSLAELMVAMVVTLIVTGSIYGLMAQGGNSFKRDPEITERQQNIRIAMDLIMRDLDIAGMGMSSDSQVFSDGLDGAGLANHLGGDSDVLELFGNDGTCPDAAVEPGIAATSGGNVNTLGEIPSCYPEPGLVLITYEDGGTKWGNGWNIHAQNAKLNFPPGQQPAASEIQAIADLTCSSTTVPCPAANQNVYPQSISIIRWIRYEIAADTDGVPSLYRTDTGGTDLTTGATTSPPGTNWQLVARGIEDMQIQYLREDPADTTPNDNTVTWQDTPGAVDGTNLDTLVQQVRVTISARTTGLNVQGSTSAAAGPDAIRGSLTTVMAPRAALYHLSQAASPLWR